MDVEQLLKMKKTLLQLREQASKLQGGREVLLERLQKDYGCNSVSEGKLLIQKMEQSLEEKKANFQQKYASFEMDLNQHAKNSHS